MTEAMLDDVLTTVFAIACLAFLAFITLRHQSTSMSKRKISLKARKIALKILEQAEKERLQVAEEEARRGINWEKDV